MIARIRALGLARVPLIIGIAVASGVFFYMGTEGHRGEALGGILIVALLILFVQQGLARRERLLFAAGATALGVLALAAGLAADALL